MITAPKKIKVTPQMYASKGKRFANFLIDYVIRLVFGLILGVVLGVLAEITGDYGYIGWIENMNRLEELIFSLTLLLLYYLVFETFTGRTLGKYITNTKVVTIDGQKPEADKILYRTLSRLIPFDALSFLGDEGKGWHDTLSKTIVVDVAKFNEGSMLQTSLEEIGTSENESSFSNL